VCQSVCQVRVRVRVRGLIPDTGLVCQSVSLVRVRVRGLIPDTGLVCQSVCQVRVRVRVRGLIPDTGLVCQSVSLVRVRVRGSISDARLTKTRICLSPWFSPLLIRFQDGQKSKKRKEKPSSDVCVPACLRSFLFARSPAVRYVRMHTYKKGKGKKKNPGLNFSVWRTLCFHGLQNLFSPPDYDM